MALTAGDLTQRISQIKVHAEQTLQRCQNAPYPSIERTQRVQELLDESKKISERAGQVIRDLEGPARAAFEASQQELRDRQESLAEVDRRARNLEQIFQARQAEHNARVKEARAKNQDQNELNNAWTIATREHQARLAELNAQRQEIQSHVSDLTERGKKQREQLNAELSRIHAENAPDELLEADADMARVLDRAGLLEKQIDTGANLELVSEARAAFRDKTGDFSDAENYHRRQAHFMLGAMSAVLLVAATAIYYLFIVPSLLVVTGDATGTKPLEATVSTLFEVEKIAVLATGRVAILFFLAWTVKYVAGLHRSHSEQAIVYRDRRAALGVAELLLNATPELDQKRNMLQTLTEAYLTIDQSRRAASTDSSETSSAGDARKESIIQLKELLQTFEPILDVVRKVSSRG